MKKTMKRLMPVFLSVVLYGFMLGRLIAPNGFMLGRS